jgi:hypothetical protein
VYTLFRGAHSKHDTIVFVDVLNTATAPGVPLERPVSAIYKYAPFLENAIPDGENELPATDDKFAGKLLARANLLVVALIIINGWYP